MVVILFFCGKKVVYNVLKGWLLDVEFVFIDLVYYIVLIVDIFYVRVEEVFKLFEFFCCLNFFVGIIKYLLIGIRKRSGN